ncbi:MAG: hypothetical protein ACD_51C00097G0013 [uncultured bacterium]|nr:MAG: hypothetical protein ACD_51C00097G0013 [uncultured bacterium]OGJ48069.1 MAG: hypothetical protein A2244_01100 [Candidatus Peregrinibacteria bacterium RIFOXYA2_FULL_41_18]OGJ48273.1 MAG: hypothetical protein A2344_04035 [Candidatus Peregrinibacteria bacterium RIFOXYB12_FULL_41_12]OGJ53713.1 MAG: hypothetical protein A2448_01485 [Candidatus Peregrinibacteria bacterium RIFOXYC2_FULL_41_22]OGJ54404.1 MAG: hypothetical protein A2336_02905 [Candidatus Peregrinibacteria bacterium RIFOXYB2_FULL
MVNQLITIGEAADLVNKSAQTIRRLIKGNKIKFKRKRTPQGFNYVVDKASLLEFFQLLKNSAEIADAPIQTPVQMVTQITNPTDEIRSTVSLPRASNEIYLLEAEDVVMREELPDESDNETPMVSQQPIQTPVTTTQPSQPVQTVDYTNVIEKLIDQHRQDKEKLYQLLEVFQGRIVGLEEHIRLLQSPKKKWWERFFK